MPDVRTTVARWTRASNRRRLAEAGVLVFAGATFGALLGIGLLRLPVALASVGVEPSWADPAWLRWTAVCVAGLCVLATAGLAWQRYRRGRLDSLALARSLDARHRTDDVLSTAMALEDGTIQASPDLAGIVNRRAGEALARVERPVEPFAAPMRAWSAVGIAAALVALLPAASEAAAQVDPTLSDAEALSATTPPAPPLSESTLEQLERDAQMLSELAERPALKPEVRDSLREAGARLRELRGDPQRALGRLSRADRALRELARDARDSELFDPEALEKMSNDELAQELAKAMQDEQSDVAEAMARELARRLENASEYEMQEMADALERAMEQASPSGDASPDGPSPSTSTPSKEEKAGGDTPGSSSDGTKSDEASAKAGGPSKRSWKDAARSIPEKLRAGQSALSRSELRQMAEEIARRPGRSSLERGVDEARSNIDRARSEQLGKMNGEGKGGEGEKGTAPSGSEPGDTMAPGDSAGEPGEPGSDGPPGMGPPIGRPGGNPGPGGGAGSDDKDPARALPPSSLYAPEHVETPSEGPPGGAVRAIERFANGYRDGDRYDEVHREYRSIAEAAVRREEIPLTRRDYIRSYFEAVRGD